jgi:hypothetical protein
MENMQETKYLRCKDFYQPSELLLFGPSEVCALPLGFAGRT